MATVQRETEIARNKSFVWDAIRDVGAIHKRLVPGFVVDCKLDGDSRIVTFANGMVIREVIVAVDEETCRHVWSARGKPFTHHNASIQVFSQGSEKSRVVWIADVMPNDVADTVGEMMSRALVVMRQTLETEPACN
jgi:carbon monoxide dehydrogenase subunit G